MWTILLITMASVDNLFKIIMPLTSIPFMD